MKIKVTDYQIEVAAMLVMQAMPDAEDFNQLEVEAAIRAYLPRLVKQMLRQMPEWMDAPGCRPAAFARNLPRVPISDWQIARDVNCSR